MKRLTLKPDVRLFAAALIVGLCAALQVHAQGVSELTSCNSNADEYAPALLATAGATELWFTRGVGERNRELVKVRVNKDGSFGTIITSGGSFKHAPTAYSSLYETVALNGCPSFGVCLDSALFGGQTAYGVYVSDREHMGKFYENDLYECYPGRSGWLSTRLDDLCSPYWDDTPFLSTDGTYLLFSSDRARPYSGTADIYISHRRAGKWSPPQPLDGINSVSSSQESPFVGPDGYLYFTSNDGGTFDIWRVQFDADKGEIVPGSKPKEWSFDDVNKSDSDERHPVFSTDGRICLFSSNRNGSYDLFQVVLDDERPDLTVSCYEMGCNTIVKNERAVGVDDYKLPWSGNIEIEDVDRGTTKTFAVPAGGVIEISYEDIVGKPTLFASPPRHFRVQAVPAAPDFVSSRVDLTVDDRCSYHDSIEVAVVKPDTCEYYSCALSYVLADTRMYVNAYWCATTRMYGDYLGPCISVFDDEAFKNQEDHEHNTDCIDFIDAEKNAGKYAADVDRQIPALVEDIRKAFMEPCVQRALRDKKTIDISVIGYTDRAGYESHCKYVGPPIVFSGNSVSIGGSTYHVRFKENPGRPYNGIIREGEAFVDHANGNQLLSDLRGIHFAILLDSLLKDSIDLYRIHRQGEKPLIRLLAEGDAYRPTKESPPPIRNARHRSVRVDITVRESLVRNGVPVPEPVSLGSTCPCKLADVPHIE